MDKEKKLEIQENDHENFAGLSRNTLHFLELQARLEIHLEKIE